MSPSPSEDTILSLNLPNAMNHPPRLLVRALFQNIMYSGCSDEVHHAAISSRSAPSPLKTPSGVSRQWLPCSVRCRRVQIMTLSLGAPSPISFDPVAPTAPSSCQSSPQSPSTSSRAPPPRPRPRGRSGPTP
ncbi:hypothetical protein G6O67_005001 [Ophiocordyceps sinensis]|uniref:Uncharacterized protein n=1 Tax=Ophiocordyceps sinensis TaxID=72228 RepID=A0A8H4PQK3_9HYPO|nr:hypothetical protein G6O67_005001 [Ophiocordyceps sinensis]